MSNEKSTGESMLKKPVIFVNFKTYMQVSSDAALRLAKHCAWVAEKTGVLIVVIPQAVDLRHIVESVDVPIFAQHVDPDTSGACTGAQVIESLKSAGVCGSLLNHVEKQVSYTVIKQTLAHAKALKFKMVVCASNYQEVRGLALLRPDYIAVEPPDLIGGKISVSLANPDLLKNCVGIVGKNCLVVGAGIHTARDVKVAFELGACGVLVSSGIVLAKNQKKALLNLVSKI